MNRNLSRKKVTCKARPISMRDMELANPGSVWCSLVTRSDWLKRLTISPLARKLSNLREKKFEIAVNKVLAS